jgi:hypothetical protein
VKKLHNQNGFALPLMLCLLMLLAAASLYWCESLLMEKRIVQQQEYVMQLDSLIQVGMKTLLTEENGGLENAVLRFGQDVVAYQVRSSTDTTATIQITAELGSGQRKSVVVSIDLAKGTLRDYREVNP